MIDGEFLAALVDCLAPGDAEQPAQHSSALWVEGVPPGPRRDERQLRDVLGVCPIAEHTLGQVQHSASVPVVRRTEGSLVAGP